MNTSDSPLISVQNLQVVFDNFVAVNDVSFDIPAGEIRGVLGGNGAGKSTVLRVLGNVIRPTNGHVNVAGHSLSTYYSSNQARSLTGYCPDVGGLVSGATPLEHVRLVASLKKDRSLYEKGVKAIEDFGLAEFKNTPVSGFSHGMMRRLSVLLAYISAQKLLILDEPYDGLDVLGVSTVNEVIRQAQADGLAVILSTHLQSLLTDISDNINIMSKGTLLGILPAESLVGAPGEELYEHLLEESLAQYEADRAKKLEQA